MLEDLIMAATNEALRKVEEGICSSDVQAYRRPGRRISFLRSRGDKKLEYLQQSY